MPSHTSLFSLVLLHDSIGDAYVIVAGFPWVKLPGGDDGEEEQKADAETHALNCINMAFDMLSVVKRVKTVEGGVIEMRIGYVKSSVLIDSC